MSAGVPSVDPLRGTSRPGLGSIAEVGPTSEPPTRPTRRWPAPLTALLLAACVTVEVAGSSRAETGPLYGSMADTVFDLIETGDPTAFVCLDSGGRASREIWDKRVDGEPTVEAYTFTARFADGLTVQVNVNPEFGSEAAARAEATYHMTALGRIPTRLREGVGRFGIHDGTPTFSAGPLGGGMGPSGERGRIIAYAERARMRAAEGGLEETMFHEAVHASLDREWAGSEAWRAAQEADGRFLTAYGEADPEGEDLADTAPFAHALMRHPERIPPADRRDIRAAIPNRLAVIAGMLPPEEPAFVRIAEPEGCAEGAADR